MGKTFIFLLLLVLLGFGVYFFVFKDRDLFSKKEAAFQIKDTANVYKIYMADKIGNKVTLSRTDSGWIVDNKYPAGSFEVNTLLSTLAAQEASYPVPETKHNTVIKLLSARSVKVELYDKDGQKFRVFYLGGQADNNEGTYMLMEGAERPYVVQIPGFPGYLTPRYDIVSRDWRSRLVCDIPSSALKQVKLFYPEEPLNSFTLEKSRDGDIKVLLDPSLNFNPANFNGARAKSYTSFFGGLYCEGYVNGVDLLNENIKSTIKRCVIDVESWKGNKQHIEVYWMPLSKRSKNRLTPFPEGPAEFDADRFFAVINDFRDTVIIQRQMFEKVFRKGYEFYQSEKGGDTVKIPLNKRAGSVIMKK